MHDIVSAAPEACCEPCEVSGAHSRRFHAYRASHRCVDNIGLKLHQEIIHACAAVHLQRRQMNSRIQLHHVKHIAGLESQRFQRCPDNMIFVYAAGQPCYGAAGVRIPVRSSESGKSRNHIASIRVRDSCRKIFRIR